MRAYRLFFLIIAFMIYFESALADSLTLSDAQLRKLQHYFPIQNDSQQYIWKGDPIAISIPIHQEKRIVFPAPVIPDLKGTLDTSQLRIINDDKSLYLTALKAFPTTRLYVTLQTTGEVILIDLTTDTQATNATVTISTQTPSHGTVTRHLVDNSHSLSATQTENDAMPDSDHYVALIRFAWQQLYAPKRLLKNPLGITRAPMHTQPMLTNLIYGDKVYAHPDASWVFNNIYITAIELRNKYPHSTRINLSHDICGHWQAATLYPRTLLKPAGTKTGDSTELFLISDKPFGDSMEVCNGRA